MPQSALSLYLRALRLLLQQGRALWLMLAGAALAVVQLVEPLLFGRMIDRLASGQGAFGLIGLWAGFGLAGIAASALLAISADRLAHRARLSAMAEGFAAALHQPAHAHASQGTGAVMRAIMAGADVLFGQWLGLLRDHLPTALSLVLLLPTAASIDLRMAAILAGLGAVYLALNLTVIRRTRAGQRAVEAQAGALHAHVGDVLGNLGTVQAYGRIGAEMQAMQGLMQGFLAAQLPVLTWWGLLAVLTRAAATLAMVAVFTLGALLAAQGEMTVGEIVSFGAFAGLLIGQLDRITGIVGGIFQQSATLGSYFTLIDSADQAPDLPGARALQAPRGAIRLEGVRFRYPGAQAEIEADFAVQPGQMVALVGASGSGKSTTLALIQRQRRPDQGRILIDGQDIVQATLASIRDHIAVVAQEGGLFNRSIAENIRVGRPEASQAEVIAAARAAEALDFIIAKPGGFDFVIGERGQALSGGERQRLALARALLKQAPILMLDEATSALDPLTEARINRALDGARQGRSLLVIAHRLATVQRADLILVFDQGRIVERGRHAELLAQGGTYAAMVQAGQMAA